MVGGCGPAGAGVLTGVWSALHVPAAYGLKGAEKEHVSAVGLTGVGWAGPRHALCHPALCGHDLPLTRAVMQ